MENCSIGAFSYVGGNVVLGNDVTIEEHCVLKNDIRIGHNVTIRSGAKLGDPGLGSIKDDEGVFHDFPHFGDIVIGDDVTIGANSVINRGSLNTTKIARGCKLLAHVWIAHGVEIGNNCFLGTGVKVAGSARIGDYGYIAPGGIIRDGVKIGNNVTVGMGSVVTKDIPDGDTWVGVPAKRMM